MKNLEAQGAVLCVSGATFNLLSFGLDGGSLEKVGGNILKNMAKNTVESVMANTTRKVAGKFVRKTFKGVAKNVVKNVGSDFIIDGFMWLSSWIIGKKIELSK